MMAEGVVDGVFKSKLLKKSLAAKDPVAVEAVDRACHYLAIASGNLVNTFSPEMEVYGGGVIETCGDYCKGTTLADWYGLTGHAPNVTCLMDVDRKAFADLLIDAVAQYGEGRS